ncbi:MAG: hypothetical protein RJA99_4234 [Pseudomonadota bacterium]|jgi:hypothetical protein
MFNEDLEPFFDPADFGTSAVHNAATINGIFEREYADPEGIATRLTAFVTREAYGVAVNATLTIAATTYRVVNIRPDGTGVVTLILERQ